MSLSNEKHIELLDRYIQGLCTDSESIEIKKRLESDTDFAQTYSELVTLSEGTRIDNLTVKMQLLQDLEKEYSEKGSDNSESVIVQNNELITIRRKLIRNALAALIALIMAYFAWHFMNKNKAPVPTADFHEYVIHDTARSATNKLTPQQEVAYNNFVTKDFKDAVPLLEELWENEKDTIALYYLGVSYWYQGQEVKAREILEQETFIGYKKPN